MVRITPSIRQGSSRRSDHGRRKRILPISVSISRILFVIVAVSLVTCLLLVFLAQNTPQDGESSSGSSNRATERRPENDRDRPSVVSLDVLHPDTATTATTNDARNSFQRQRQRQRQRQPREGLMKASLTYEDVPCPHQHLTDLTPLQRHPHDTPEWTTRHIVRPPSDRGGNTTLVCCRTTAGPLSIAVHGNWAPWGSRRFLHMVRNAYFDGGVPFFRCTRGFLCQFGIATRPHVTKRYASRTMRDDTQWLPAGPANQINQNGMKRFPKGYLAYAGAGKNSRTNQFIVSLEDNGRLGGGSPWEVPWGEVVGEESFVTLDSIFTGYGDRGGPTQNLLLTRGVDESVREEWPELDYITKCYVSDNEVVT